MTPSPERTGEEKSFSSTVSRVAALENRVWRLSTVAKYVDSISSSMERAYESCFLGNALGKPSIAEIDAMREAIGAMSDNKEFWHARANLQDALVDALSDLSDMKAKLREEVRE